MRAAPSRSCASPARNRHRIPWLLQERALPATGSLLFWQSCRQAGIPAPALQPAHPLCGRSTGRASGATNPASTSPFFGIASAIPLPCFSQRIGTRRTRTFRLRFRCVEKPGCPRFERVDSDVIRRGRGGSRRLCAANKLQRIGAKGPFRKIDAAERRRQEHDARLLNVPIPHFTGRNDDMLNDARRLAVLEQHRVPNVDGGAVCVCKRPGSHEPVGSGDGG